MTNIKNSPASLLRGLLSIYVILTKQRARQDACKEANVLLYLMLDGILEIPSKMKQQAFGYGTVF